jgi:hypothetical protein
VAEDYDFAEIEERWRAHRELRPENRGTPGRRHRPNDGQLPPPAAPHWGPRFRARRRVLAGLDQEEAVREALAEPAVQRVLGGKEPARAVYVPDRLLNLLV